MQAIRKIYNIFNMKLLLCGFVFLVSTMLWAGDTMPCEYISPSNMTWSEASLPAEVALSKSMKKWINETTGEGNIRRWSYVSLLDNSNSQMIIEGFGGGSGGKSFLVLTKQNGKWLKLIDINGGFIFYPVHDKNPTLVVYHRLGLEYNRTEYVFNGKKYKEKSSYEMPIELTRLNGSPIDFEKFFWFLNSGDSKVEKSKLETAKNRL
jgi:hypothetical protein